VTIALGLDVSETRMGYAAVDYDTCKPLALGVEDLRERDGGWPEDQILRATERVWQSLKDLGFWDREEVVVVGIEDAYLGPNRMASLRHASVVGMATMAARVVFGPGVTCWPIPADSWRNALGIKGRNRAEKKALTYEWALSVLDDHQFFYKGEHGLEEDAADALGIATACARLTVRNEDAA
jgi:Holliday junction resolvasome RuvABC endonuclease subunit